MTTTNSNFKRLGVRFHQTFIPERIYIAELLRFAATDGEGSDTEISDKTGIPTGKSSGKVPATIKYCQGMGLIDLTTVERQRRISLTPMGESVLKHDASMLQPLSQLLAHLNLCRRHGGAETWHLCFGPGSDRLGREFTRENLEAYLAAKLGSAKRSLIGPMLRAYADSAALKLAAALTTQKNVIRRNFAPLEPAFAWAYSAWLLHLWDVHFSDYRQVTMTDWEAATFWGRIHAWNEAQQEQALRLIQETGALAIDRQMRPWVLTRQADSIAYWHRMYSE